MFVGALVFLIAALEEIVWRGLVLRALEGPLDKVAAWLLSSALFAAAHAPTLFLLADPVAGPNPLLVAAGFGCSIVGSHGAPDRAPGSGGLRPRVLLVGDRELPRSGARDGLAPGPGSALELGELLFGDVEVGVDVLHVVVVVERVDEVQADLGVAARDLFLFLGT